MNKIRLHIIQFLFLLCWIGNNATSVLAQNQAEWILSRDSILIGDQIELKWSARIDHKYSQIQFPEWGDSFSKIEILDKGKIDTIINKDFTVYEQSLLITCFDSGAYQMPESTLLLIDENNNKEELVITSKNSLYVATIEIDPNQPFKPIVEIIDEEAPDWQTRVKEIFEQNKTLILLLAGVIILALLAWLLWIFYFKKNRKSKLPPELPHNKAHRRVRELESSDLWENHHHKEYYSQLSEIVRDYFEEQFNISANEMTTRDLLRIIKRDAHLRRVHQEMKQILRTADLTKFAKGVPTDEDHRDSVKFAYKIIEQTRPALIEQNDQ